MTGNVVAIVGSRREEYGQGYTLNRAYQSFRQPEVQLRILDYPEYT